jgi:hypothetical protein
MESISNIDVNDFNDLNLDFLVDDSEDKLVDDIFL